MRMRHGLVTEAWYGWAQVTLDGVTVGVPVSAGQLLEVGKTTVVAQQGRTMCCLGTIAGSGT